jgi:hypothetical protein
MKKEYLGRVWIPCTKTTNYTDLVLGLYKTETFLYPDAGDNFVASGDIFVTSKTSPMFR